MLKPMALFLAVIAATTCGAVAFAQDQQVTGDQDGSSQQVEESDEAYRRRMELEDARRANPTYTDPTDSYRRDLEKIDKLPEESRENIRDQLIDIIMQNDDWEPGDALKEYPYEPTAAARADPELMAQEQEAWAEQIEKYHARESAAFGAYRGPVEGPGNPDGGEGGQGNEGGQEGQQGQQGQQGGQQGQQGNEGQAGTYQPYQSQSSNRNQAESTAGVSESALDFLMNRQNGSSPGQAANQQAGQPPGANETAQAASQQQQQQFAQESSQSSSQQSESSEQQPEDSQDTEQPTEPDMRGIIAIEDLDKLEGTGGLFIPPEEEEEDEGGP